LAFTTINALAARYATKTNRFAAYQRMARFDDLLPPADEADGDKPS
jgi:hypothetical protein